MCDDGDKCNGAELCVSGKCEAGKKPDCDGLQAVACKIPTCDKVNGCSYAPAKNGTSCSDNNQCTENDICSSGKCFGKLKKCNDDNPCTSDSCKYGGQCFYQPKNCNDGSTCTTDSCDKATGKCKYTPKPGCKKCSSATQCNDNNKCTKDACKYGKCVYTKVSGCVGPTDIAIVAFGPTAKPTPAPGKATFSMTLSNYGAVDKTVGGGIYLGIVLSADDKFDSNGMDLAIFNGKWPGYNIGIQSSKVIPSKTKASASVTATIKASDKLKSVKFVCLRVTCPSDKFFSNNQKCIPIELKL